MYTTINFGLASLGKVVPCVSIKERFPQYFMNAIFAKAWAVAVVMGDDTTSINQGAVTKERESYVEFFCF